MSDDPVSNPDAVAERLEAALERIAAATLAARAVPSMVEVDAGLQGQAAAHMDGLIARLRAKLGEYDAATEPGGAVARTGTGSSDAAPRSAATADEDA